jgi:hypothetical protein
MSSPNPHPRPADNPGVGDVKYKVTAWMLRRGRPQWLSTTEHPDRAAAEHWITTDLLTRLPGLLRRSGVGRGGEEPPIWAEIQAWRLTVAADDIEVWHRAGAPDFVDVTAASGPAPMPQVTSIRWARPDPPLSDAELAGLE